MSKMGLHDPFEYLKFKLWPKKGSGIKVSINFHPLKIKNFLEICVFKWHATYFWKALDKGYNFVWTSLQSKVCIKSYGHPKF